MPLSTGCPGSPHPLWGRGPSGQALSPWADTPAHDQLWSACHPSRSGQLRPHSDTAARPQARPLMPASLKIRPQHQGREPAVPTLKTATAPWGGTRVSKDRAGLPQRHGEAGEMRRRVACLLPTTVHRAPRPGMGSMWTRSRRGSAVGMTRSPGSGLPAGLCL